MSGSRTRSPFSNNGIAQPRAMPPPPRLGNGFQNMRNAGFGEEQGSYSESYQSSQASQARSYSQAERRNEESTTKTSESFEERRVQRSRFTLADCKLSLSLSTLTIDPLVEGAFNSNTINLDDFIGNNGGELAWITGDRQPNVNFSASCTNIRLEQTFLIAMCDRGRDDAPAPSRLNLDDYIAYMAARRCFDAVVPDPEFADLMSSGKWMNFTLITQPDMRMFLRNPAFQKVIGNVARRAVEQVMTQIKEEMMRAVEEAVTRVNSESDEFVDSEMQILVKQATKTAAYKGWGELTLMEAEQRRAFRTFATHINANYMEEPTVEEPGRDGR
ncbi:hypothetical protein R3P38DRAFT_2911005 [Favolaschia claudopus]|uniref:Cyanovirin-N domain-containing protein n=1 Tax=Favolaschia claudopus TaxID=2862362 RepID=A0AAW0C969_9AGAR